MTIGKLGKGKVISASIDTSALEIAKLIKEHHVGDIIIVGKNNEPLGIITDRDIVIRIIADEVNPNTLTALDIMSYNLLILNERQSIQESLEMMAVKGVRRAPIVNDANVLVGLVSTDDLALLIANEMECYGKIIRKQLSHAK